MRPLFIALACMLLLSSGGHLRAATQVSEGSDAPDDDAQTPPWWRGPFEEDVCLVSVDRTSETDPSDQELRGLRLAWRCWQDEYDDMIGIGAGGFYLGAKEGKEQQVVDLGMELSLLNIAAGPVRFGPRIRLGLEHRDSEPHRGIGGVSSVGFQVVVWLGKRFQLGVLADREFGFESGTRDQLAFSVRFGVMSTPR